MSDAADPNVTHPPATPPAVHLAAAATAAAVLPLYLWTLAPTLGFIDSGELSAVAHTFGIAHPTGYPFFTLVAGLWAKLPLGSPIWRLNLLSALWCAAAAGVLVEVIFALSAPARITEPTASRQQRRRAGRDSGKAGASIRSPHTLPVNSRLTAAVFGGLVAGLSATWWTVGLVVEVYSLHLLLASVVLLTAVKALPEGEDCRSRWLAALAFALGLSFANHLTTIYLVPGLAVAYFWHRGVGAAGWLRAARVIPFFVAGLLPYVYLPVRAAQGPALAWGDPTSVERLLWHVSGKQYRDWVFSSTEVAGRQLRYFLTTYPGELAWIGLLLAPVGLVWCWRHRRRWAVALITWYVVAVGYSINYDIHDIDSYFLLAHLVTAVVAALGLLSLLGSSRWRRAGLVLAVTTPLVMAAVNLPRVSERGNYLVEDYARNILDSLEKNAVVLSYQWDYWVSASYYLQLVEGVRPDVTVVDTELVRRSHYLTQMARNHPDTWPVASPAIAAFATELAKFEHDRPYDPAVIDRAYYRVLDTIVEHNHLQGRPVYVTLEIGPEIGGDFVRIPEGLAFRLYRQWDLPDPDHEVVTDIRFRPFGRSDRLVEGIVNATSSMLTNRGLYLFSHGRVAEAASLADRALEIEPGLAIAEELRQRCAAATLH